MRRLLVISILPFVLAGCPDKKDAAKAGASAEPVKSAAPDPGAQDKAGTDKKEEDKGGW